MCVKVHKNSNINVFNFVFIVLCLFNSLKILPSFFLLGFLGCVPEEGVGGATEELDEAEEAENEDEEGTNVEGAEEACE